MENRRPSPVDKMRLFVAMDIPEGIKEVISSALGGCRDRMEGVRWVKPENIHLTVKFIGDYPEEKLGRLVEEIRKAALRSPKVSALLGGCGAFPSQSKARVIWVDMRKGGEEAAIVARKVDSRLGKIGVKREKRPFRGHLTLGRLKRPKDCSDLLGRIEENLQELAEMPFAIEEVVLFRSILSSKGPTYVPLQRIELGGD
jgi:2'-5' RNA ligase